LHSQAPFEFGNWTVVNATIVGVVDHSAFSSVTSCKGKAHPDVLGRRPTAIHELVPFFHILDERNLLDRLVDDELIANKVVLDLWQWLVKCSLQIGFGNDIYLQCFQPGQQIRVVRLIARCVNVLPITDEYGGMPDKVSSGSKA
jgi:hypothetical protein